MPMCSCCHICTDFAVSIRYLLPGIGNNIHLHDSCILIPDSFFFCAEKYSYFSTAMESTQTSALNKILSFLKEIGIAVVERDIPEATFLPGLSLGANCIYMDPLRLLYPGDLLHEAGHLAVATPEQRCNIDTDRSAPGWPDAGEEMGAILWSYAALKYIGMDAAIVFHAQGYKNDSEWLINSFRDEVYIGLPFLEWIGLALSETKAKQLAQPAFPAMLKWLRE